MTQLPPFKPIGPDPDLEAFREVLATPPERFHLFHGALLLSSHEHPGQPDGWWRQWHETMNDLAGEARRTIGETPALTTRVELKRLCTCFCDTLGFAGDEEDYSSPRNSCLTDVLKTRRGLPISLSVVLVTLGKRLGFDMYGVGTPGHFLTGARVGSEEIFIDPFRGPELLSREEAIERIALQMGIFREAVVPFMDPCEPRQVLIRMLNNLKMSYRSQSDPSRLLRVINWLLAADPGNMPEIRNRGLLLMRLGNTTEGAEDLMKYVQGSPDADDLEVVRQEILRAMEIRAQWN